MNLPQYARTMAAYNAWMNQRLYQVSACLSDDQRKKDLGAFFKSIHGTLNHLLLADLVWLGRFAGKLFKVDALDQELYADFEVLRQQRELTDRRIKDWAEALQTAEIPEFLTYSSISKPRTISQPFWIAVVHFFNHQTHHRGQVTTLLKQCGVDPGVTDMIWMPGLPDAAQTAQRH